MNRLIVATLVAIFLPSGVTPLHAQDATADTPKKLIVGVKEAPPFAIKTAEGNWTGISVELWRGVAEDLKLTYEWKEMTLPELLDGLEQGRVDVGIGALTVTAEREEAFDFSHPFHSSGLGIAVKRRGGNQLLTILGRLVSSDFLAVIATLALLLLAVGFLVWVFERKRNADEFGAGRGKGLGAGFWWAAVTMTTVGYGDKAPITLGGRLVALVWMFASIIVISIFTAGITTALTVSSLESSISGPEDLPRARVGTVNTTTSSAYLDDNGVPYINFDTAADAVLALGDGDIDAVVYDAPILKWLVQNNPKAELRVLPATFERQDYGIAMRTDSGFRERVSRAVLQRIGDSAWDKMLQRYLGK